MRDKFLNFIIAIFVLVLFLYLSFKTLPADVQNHLHNRINNIKIQYFTTIDFSNNPIADFTSNLTVNSKEKKDSFVSRTKFSSQIERLKFEFYVRSLRNEIKSKWKPKYVGFRKKCVLWVTVSKNGKLIGIAVAPPFEPEVMGQSLEAVESVKHFRPFPENTRLESITVQFVFDYNIIYNNIYYKF